MNYRLVWRLTQKDWYLNRWMMLASLLTGGATLGVLATVGGSEISVVLGIIVLATILIGMGAVVMSTSVNERKQHTLPFVMSLPISYLEYTTSKILGSLLIFLVLWVALLAGAIITLLTARSLSPSLIPFIVIISTEILVSNCLITAVSVTTESQGWMIAITQLGGIGLNAFGYYVAHLPGFREAINGGAMYWNTSATLLLLGEVAAIAVIIGITFFIQSRKRDFI